MGRGLCTCLGLLLLGLRPAGAGEAGKIPLDYPAVPTTAQAGQWVLCPPREFVNNLEAKGAEKTTIIYYAATLAEPGPVESKVVSLTRKEMMIPNSLIVPLPKGQTAKPGDVVLTWWHSGSGMQRAIVVEGGTDTEPMVLYLDITYDNPSGWGKKTDRCKPDSFYLLKEAFGVGSTVAVRHPKAPKTFKRCQIVHAAEDKLLLLGYAGRLSIAKKADCVALPIVPEGVKEGDSVWSTTTFDTLSKVTVKKVDAKIGRVFVTFTSFGKEKEMGIAYGDIIPALP